MERERWRERDGERDALLLLRRRKGLGNYTLQACHELAKCINQRLKRSLHVFRRCFANGVLLYAASSTPESLSPILFLYFLLSYPSNRRIRFPFGALSSSLTSFFTRFFLKVYFFFSLPGSKVNAGNVGYPHSTPKARSFVLPSMSALIPL